jgi:hypothetical protein
MSNNGYHRCEYPPDVNGGRECEVWFPSEEGRLCIMHRNSAGPELAHLDESLKSEYIRLRNEQSVLCHKMSLDELDIHIAGIEKVIENERTKLLAARAKRSDKLQLLSDEEREERRKIKYVPNGEGRERIKKETKAEKLKATIKSDPVGYFMESLNFSREAAEAFCTANGIKFSKES